MNELSQLPWLTLLIALPVGGALATLLWDRRAALATAILELLLALALLPARPTPGSVWLRLEDRAWIERFGVRFSLGLDGLALLMILLTAALLLAAVLVSWSRYRARGFYALLLASSAGIVGVFLARDLLLFYLCWEVMLLPLVLLIARWGGPLRQRAALKLLLFTLAGSLLMLLAFLALYLLHGQQTGSYTFALQALTATALPQTLAPWLLTALGLAFLVKIPVVPLHGWLPDAYAEAPTGASLLMAGALSKTGLYGLARIVLPLLPNGLAPVAPLLAALALLSILYGAWLAYAQSDLKRLVGHASIAHLGFIVLGLAGNNVLALEGALLQLFNHGITTAALFVLVGMVERRTGTRQLDALGGLWGHAPQLGAFVLFFALAALGLPGLNIFVGEILILLGAFRANAWWGAAGMLGVLLAACYTLRLAQGVLWGPPRPDRALRDLSRGEAGLLAPLAALVLWGGLYPGSFLLLLHEPVRQLLAAMAGKGGLP